MKKILVFVLLLFSIKNFGQTPKSDSLKMIIRKLAMQPISIRRDSLLTVTFYELSKSHTLTENDHRQFWTDSLSRFSKISKWEQTIAYSHSRNGVYYFRKGYSKLAFQETEKAVELFKKFHNEKYYTIAFLGLTGQIRWD